MLSRLANYLLGGASEAAEDSQEQAEAAAATTIRKDEFPPGTPMEARLRQVTVEGDDWILVDRHSMDESWYVTPPACFTQPGPVHVETSPLEDLLIEHPSMSVYRSAGQDSPTDSSTVGNPSAAVVFLGKHPRKAAKNKAAGKAPRTPLARRNVDNVGNVVSNVAVVGHPNGLVVKAPTVANDAHLRDNKRGNNNNHNNNNNHAAQGGQEGVVEEMPRRTSIKELRSSRNDENMRIQIRSSQKIMEKRSSSASKRNILERGNKVREATTGKGKRPRRQDRLRLNNSNANNNRKC